MSVEAEASLESQEVLCRLLLSDPGKFFGCDNELAIDSGQRAPPR